MHLAAPRTAVVMLVAAAALVVVAAHPAGAQRAHDALAAADRGKDDMEKLSNYRLTEATLKKYEAAMRNIMAAAMKDSTLQGAADDEASGDGDGSLAAMAERFERIPAFKRALNAAGLSGMDLALFSLSMMQAGMAYSLMQAPAPYRPKELPKGTPKENVEFFRTHQAEFQRLQQELKGTAAPGDAGADTTTSPRLLDGDR